jgi:hypothetical protein
MAKKDKQEHYLFLSRRSYYNLSCFFISLGFQVVNEQIDWNKDAYISNIYQNIMFPHPVPLVGSWDIVTRGRYSTGEIEVNLPNTPLQYMIEMLVKHQQSFNLQNLLTIENPYSTIKELELKLHNREEEVKKLKDELELIRLFQNQMKFNEGNDEPISVCTNKQSKEELINLLKDGDGDVDLVLSVDPQLLDESAILFQKELREKRQ